MNNLLEHTHLTERSRELFLKILRQCPSVFRERELHWQIKMLSRYAAERDFFEACIEQKAQEVKLILPHVKITLVPPGRSIPLKNWTPGEEGWPNACSLITQIFLHQILNSSDLFLDLGSSADAFFISPTKDLVCWIPDTRGTRWHDPFRRELARFYLGWAFEQERLVDVALLALHLVPLKDDILSVINHWRSPLRDSSHSRTENILELFRRAEALSLHLHPNVLVWMLYELEVQDVLSVLGLKPDLERAADDLCRSQCQMSA